MHDLRRSFRPPIEVLANVGIAPKHPAEIAAAVIVVLRRTFGKLAGAHQLVVQGQERTSKGTILLAGDVFPSAVRQEPVIAARDQLGAVFENRPVCGFDDAPMIEYLRLRIPPPSVPKHRAVNLVPRTYFGHGTCAPIPHQNGRVSPGAVSAPMAASAI